MRANALRSGEPEHNGAVTPGHGWSGHRQPRPEPRLQLDGGPLKLIVIAVGETTKQGNECAGLAVSEERQPVAGRIHEVLDFVQSHAQTTDIGPL